MTYTIQREAIAGLWDELFPLLEQHKSEIGSYQDWTLKPDRETYARIEALGKLRVWTARWDDTIGPSPHGGWLVGYLCMTVSPNLHYADVLMAYQDVLFVAPEHRAKGAGLKLLRQAENDCRAEGCSVIAQRCKARADINLTRLYEALGYEMVDLTFMKRLDRPAVECGGMPATRQESPDFHPHDATKGD